MSSISALAGGSTGAWADYNPARAGNIKDKLFAKADVNGSGGVDATELQTLFDKIAKKTGTTAADASQQFSSIDSDSSGSLSADELDAGMKSLMPPPSSTVDFAQRRTQGAGGPHGPNGHSGPPPAEKASGSDKNSATTDPLDTNGDGTVSLQERAAGMVKELAQALVTAMDSNQDGSISKDETSSFKARLTAAAGASSNVPGTDNGGTGTAVSGSAAASETAATGGQTDAGRGGRLRQGLDLSALVDMIGKAYNLATQANSQNSSISVSA